MFKILMVVILVIGIIVMILYFFLIFLYLRFFSPRTPCLYNINKNKLHKMGKKRTVISNILFHAFSILI